MSLLLLFRGVGGEDHEWFDTDLLLCGAEWEQADLVVAVLASSVDLAGLGFEAGISLDPALLGEQEELETGVALDSPIELSPP